MAGSGSPQILDDGGHAPRAGVRDGQGEILVHSLRAIICYVSAFWFACITSPPDSGVV